MSWKEHMRRMEAVEMRFVKAVVGRKVTDYKRNEDEMHEFFSRPHVC
jgi:hypothetical protein